MGSRTARPTRRVAPLTPREVRLVRLLRETVEAIRDELIAGRCTTDPYAHNVLLAALACCPPASGDLSQVIEAFEALVARHGIERLDSGVASAYLCALLERVTAVQSRLRYLAGHFRRRYTLSRARPWQTLERQFGYEQGTMRGRQSIELHRT